MFDFEQHLSELGTQTVLCVGDLMLDEFVYGEVSRISPEAPAQVIAVSRQETVIGGAGNVARNIASLGAHCLFVGVVGEDEPGRQLMAALLEESQIEPYLVIDGARPTTRACWSACMASRVRAVTSTGSRRRCRRCIAWCVLMWSGAACRRGLPIPLTTRFRSMSVTWSRSLRVSVWSRWTGSARRWVD